MTIRTGLVAGALLLGCILGAYAQDAVQANIQAAYDRGCLAMRYKYVEGVLGLRDRTFQAFGPSGQPIRPVDEIKSLQSILSQATAVSETTTIVHFVQVNDHEVRTRIKDVIQLERPHSAGKPNPPILVRTVADDTWILSGHDWKLSQSRVREQHTDNQ